MKMSLKPTPTMLTLGLILLTGTLILGCAAQPDDSSPSDVMLQDDSADLKRTCKRDFFSETASPRSRGYVRRCNGGKLGARVNFECVGGTIDGVGLECSPSDGLGFACTGDRRTQIGRQGFVEHCNKASGHYGPRKRIAYCLGGTNDGSESICFDADGDPVLGEEAPPSTSDSALPGGG
jgi:hypothetical protein